jgi:tRNA 2-selenouridine synthase
MLQKNLPISDFLAHQPGSVLLDVRSPKEFAHGHIPGAISFPLFTDDERHRVGLCYKQKGRDQAVLLGLELVGPKLATFVKEAKRLAETKPVLLYCWRGGMRSNSMAILLSTAGFHVSVLQKGYKAYRTWALQLFEKPFKLITIGGYTGTGKTFLLKELSTRGHQVIDLEGLAGHQGSAFGNLAGIPQPTTEQFENNLALQLAALNLELPIFLEDESMAIGQVRIPLALHRSMQKAPLLFLQKAEKMRLAHVMAHYGLANKTMAEAAFKRLEKRLGGQNVKLAIEAIHQNNTETACKIALAYYDKIYYSGLDKRKMEYFMKIDANCADAELALKVAEKSTEIYG